MLKEYLLPCDAHFYSVYAKPLVCAHSSLFDLDVFDATKTTNTTNGTSSFDNDNVLPDDFTQAFTKFENDSLAQYEMHPRFGRYVST